MTLSKSLFSSESIEWGTPDDLFNALQEVFWFTLDPCSTKENAKCSKFYTKEDDGLAQSWADERVFVNPPYGRTVTETWVQKSYQESVENNAMVVMLLPARTDTKFQHNLVFRHAVAIAFIKGRLKFSNCKDSAPFPSQIVVFTDGGISGKQIQALSKLGHVIFPKLKM